MIPVPIRAVYQNGIFKPLDEVELPEGTEVEVVVRRAGPILRKYAGLIEKSNHDWEAEYYEYLTERAHGG